MVLPFRADAFRAQPRPVSLLADNMAGGQQQQDDTNVLVPCLVVLAAFCALMAYYKS